MRQSDFRPAPNGFDLQHIQITTAQPRCMRSVYQFLAHDKQKFDLQHIQITIAQPRCMRSLYQFLAHDKQKQWHSQEADQWHMC